MFTPSHSTLTISAGLSDRFGDPLSATEADAFRDSITLALKLNGAEIIGDTTTPGHGYWQGSSERCHFAIAIVPIENVDRIRATLAVLAVDYSQDAIGCIIHDEATYGPSYVAARI